MHINEGKMYDRADSCSNVSTVRRSLWLMIENDYPINHLRIKPGGNSRGIWRWTHCTKILCTYATFLNDFCEYKTELDFKYTQKIYLKTIPVSYNDFEEWLIYKLTIKSPYNRDLLLSYKVPLLHVLNYLLN